jgi:hypothetical protein
VGLGAARRGDSGPDDVDESIDCRGGRVASRSEGVNATAAQFLGTNVLSYRAPASAASATKPEIRSSSCRCNCEPPRCGAAPPQARRRRGGGASDTCPHTFAGRIADEQSACPHRARQPAASRAMLPDQRCFGRNGGAAYAPAKTVVSGGSELLIFVPRRFAAVTCRCRLSVVAAPRRLVPEIVPMGVQIGCTLDGHHTRKMISKPPSSRPEPARMNRKG